MSKAAPSILLVDDDPGFLKAASTYAQLKGSRVDTAASVAEGRRATARGHYDLVLVDLTLPDGNGLELLDGVDLGGSGQFVVVTANPSVESAIRALQLPVIDYLVKPIDGARLQQIIQRATEAMALRPHEHDERDTCGELLGSSASMHQVFDQIRRVAPMDVTVFIHGESGTGKDLAARAIHDCSRQTGRFVAVNCGAVASELLTSQLFGHEKGSFTGAVRDHPGQFEQARHGTIFLDEVTEMPAHLQTHLLRVLETHEIERVGSTDGMRVDVRVIAATNRDPQQAVADGALRADLYYRLMDFPLAMPPLREHPADIPLLAAHFLGRLNARYGTRRRFAAHSVDHLLAYHWPGNARELKHVVQRAYVISRDELLIERMPAAPLVTEGDGPVVNFRVGMTIEEVEKQMLLKTLAHFDNDKARAAEALGVSLKTIYNKLSRYGTET